MGFPLCLNSPKVNGWKATSRRHCSKSLFHCVVTQFPVAADCCQNQALCNVNSEQHSRLNLFDITWKPLTFFEWLGDNPLREYFIIFTVWVLHLLYASQCWLQILFMPLLQVETRGKVWFGPVSSGVFNISQCKLGLWGTLKIWI